MGVRIGANSRENAQKSRHYTTHIEIFVQKKIRYGLIVFKFFSVYNIFKGLQNKNIANY